MKIKEMLVNMELMRFCAKRSEGTWNYAVGTSAYS